MANGIRSTGEFEPSAIRADEIVVFDLARIGGEIPIDVREAKSLDRAADQGWNIRMFFSLALSFQRALHTVGSTALAFGGSDRELVASDGKCAGLPHGGNKPRGRDRTRPTANAAVSGSFLQIYDLENGDRVEASRCCEEILSVGREHDGLKNGPVVPLQERPEVLVVGAIGNKNGPGFHVHCSHGIGVCESDVERLSVRA